MKSIVLTTTWLTMYFCCAGVSYAQEQPLLEATFDGDVEVVLDLLEHGADVNASTEDGATALMVASQDGHAELVRLLLEHGADVDASRKDSATALIMASQNGHAKIVRALLEQGADVNAAGGVGATALIAASHMGRLGSVRALLEYGADVNEHMPNGRTALIVASEGRHPEVVSALLEHGANVDARGNDGLSPLDFTITEAAGKELADVLGIRELLLEAGAVFRPGYHFVREGDAVVVAVDSTTMDHLLSSFGLGVLFVTNIASPITALQDIVDLDAEVAVGSPGLGLPMMQLLSLAQVGSGDRGVRGIGNAFFSALFSEFPELRLFAVEAQPEQQVREVLDTGGGIRVEFRRQ